MKKGLALLLAASMTLSAFGSVAGAAELTAQEKFDALKAEGIFTGFEDGSAGLEQSMTRAQVAAIITRLLDLSENAASAATYTDLVGAEWAAGYIGAVTPTYMEGYGAGKFAPSDTLTLQQLATVMTRVLDLEVEADATVEGTVDDWAKGYVAAAVKANVIDAASDYTQPAPRTALVAAAYTANEIVGVPALAAISTASAAGVQTVKVDLNKEVDTEKATLALKKGAATVATTVKWADDKKSATLTLKDVKITAGEYTVTLGGVDEIDSAKASATFTAESEKVEKLEFVTAGDTLAHADSVIVKARAVNQYGEAASTNAGAYSVYTSGASFTKITKAEDGTLLITLDTDTADTTPSVSVIPVTLVNTDNYLTVTKNFKLGTQQILSKAELGEARYSTGTALTGKGQNVKFDLHIFDQYGNEITWETLEDDFQLPTVIWNDYIDEDDINEVVEDNGNNIPQVKVSLVNNLDKSADYRFTVLSQGATATGTVSVKSTKVATKVQIGDVEDVIASGDTDVYVPIIAYDADGNQLSIEDLTSDENVDNRITINVSGATAGTKIEKSGTNKGSVKLTNVTAQSKGAVSITAVIATPTASSTATKTFTVADARVADRFKEITAPAKSIVPGAKSKFKFNVIDQYGAKLDDSLDVTSTGNVTGGNIHYSVVVKAVPYNADGTVAATDDFTNLYIKAPTGAPAANVTKAGITFENGVGNSDFEFFNKDFEVISAAGATAYDRIVFTAQIFKKEGADAAVEISKVTRTVEVADADAADLTYSVATATTIFNALDNKAVTGSVYDEDEFEANPGDVLFAHEIKVSAKDAAGEKVAVPASIQQVRSSNEQVAIVKMDGNKAYVIGYKTGSATLNVVYKTIDGETKQASLPVTVSNEPISVATLTAGEKKATVTSGANAAVAMDLKVVDNYGSEYEDGEVNSFNFLLGVTYSVQNVNVPVGVTVSVAADGTITKTGAGTAQFDLVVTSPNGKSVTTAITIN